MTNFELAARIFVQLALVLAACRVVGLLLRPLGQPQVVAEMVTGVLLGPSLFGLMAPALHARLFPEESLRVLYVLAQIGIVLFMFLVGLELDLALVRSRLRGALAVTVAGMVAPFALGAALAWALRERHDLFPAAVTDWEAMLFLGAAMSITAFPTLARILYERGLSHTVVGSLALAAGSLTDAAAWCLLALVLASLGGTATTALIAIGGGALFAVVLGTVGRRSLAILYRALLARSGSTSVLPVTLVLLFLAATATDLIGVHAVFGAFVLGAAMPRGALQQQLEGDIAPLATGLLVPVFFVHSGLLTKLGLLISWELLGVTLVVLILAIVGKGVASALAARWSGEPWRDATAIGVLMNARGLMELIILGIGLEHGVITPTLFSIMALMAIVTTVMAVPAFTFLHRPSVDRPVRADV